MRSLAHAIVRSLESGQALELVTVLTASGSTPRGPGAMLAVFSDGTAVGTVGGGNVEFEATAVAKSLLQSQQDALREFRLIQGDAASLGMVCGGDLTLHFQYLSADDASTLALFRELLEATGQNRDVWLVRRLDNEKVSPTGPAGECSCPAGRLVYPAGSAGGPPLYLWRGARLSGAGARGRHGGIPSLHL